MTAKEKVNRFNEICYLVESTGWFRMLKRLGKIIGFAGILWTGSVFLQVRDAVRDAPKLRIEIDRHEKQFEAVNQKISLILLNDNNHKVPTDYLRPIFHDIDGYKDKE